MPRIASAYYDDHYFGHADQVTDPDELDHDLLICGVGKISLPHYMGSLWLRHMRAAVHPCVMRLSWH